MYQQSVSAVKGKFDPYKAIKSQYTSDYYNFFLFDSESKFGLSNFGIDIPNPVVSSPLVNTEFNKEYLSKYNKKQREKENKNMRSFRRKMNNLNGRYEN